MNRGVFVTGTDTDCGKTFVATALIRSLKARGVEVGALKPVAAGAVIRDGNLQNDDALTLCAVSETQVSYADVNPYCFAPAISPHLAAHAEGVDIRLENLQQAAERMAARCDFLLVEGAGGWRVPLSDDLDIQGLALAFGLPVLLVVGLRLGCINHALLTEQAILASGAPLAGWIGSQVDPGMAHFEGNVATLRARLSSPCLGILRRSAAGDAAFEHEVLQVDSLL